MPFNRLLIPLVVLVVLVEFGVVSIAFEKLGLSQHSAYLLLTVTLLGSMFNLPLFSVTAEPPLEPPDEALFQLPKLQGNAFHGRTMIAINVGGAVTPLAFSAYLMVHNPLDPLVVTVAIAVVAAISYFTSAPIRGVGIGMPFLVAPLVTALTAIMLSPENPAPLAYIGGTVGVLIGADLLRLGEIRKLGAPVASIGGAGTFDGIFLTGLLAVLWA